MLNPLGLERTHLNIAKAMYNKPIANIILSGERLGAFPLRSGLRHECPFSPLVFNMVPSQNNQARERNKRHPNWKEVLKWII